MSPIKLALIYGSTRENRFCETIVKWAVSEIEGRPGFLLDVIDPVELNLPDRHYRDDTPEIAELKKRIGEADAFIIVTPEYNHSFPASLKFVIDSVHEQWQAKPVAFISYGGVSGGLRAVEHLRGVFAELHALTVRDTVSFANVWSHFGEDGRLLNPNGARKTMDLVLRRLTWWAVALRNAREKAPYADAAWMLFSDYSYAETCV